ncbi:MAG: lipid-binding SYLF domain-containing protein [Candidatus Kaelpia imicola]|nr:lipid-binding SYLF domain-containing protein [Candidatus Kaelpia imicola]
MKRVLVGIVLAIIVTVSLPVYAGWNAKSSSDAVEEAELTVKKFKESDSVMDRFFDKAYGYAIFPTVGKGGMGIGAAYGKGTVYEQGKIIGSTTLKQLSIGFQLGGQAYSEIIFFKDRRDLENFKSGNFELGATASAVAVTAGASADADYSDGVAVFTLPKGGLMYEATVAGQKFTYTEE